LFADKRRKKRSHLVDLIIKYYFHGSIPDNGVEIFEQHNDMIKDIVWRDKREFLEFKLGDGWEALCEFLGKDIPEIDFPRENDTKSWRKAFRVDWYSKLLAIFFTLFARRMGEQ
jgi:Sulfotransferase domain